MNSPFRNTTMSDRCERAAVLDTFTCLLCGGAVAATWGMDIPPLAHIASRPRWRCAIQATLASYSECDQSPQPRYAHWGESVKYTRCPAGLSKRPLPQGRKRQLGCQDGGAIDLVEYGVYLNEVQADHPAVFGYQLHCHMG